MQRTATTHADPAYNNVVSLCALPLPAASQLYYRAVALATKIAAERTGKYLVANCRNCVKEISPFSSETCQNIFRYSKFYSVAMMLNELALPRFEEIFEKCRCELRQQNDVTLQ